MSSGVAQGLRVTLNPQEGGRDWLTQFKTLIANFLFVLVRKNLLPKAWSLLGQQVGVPSSILLARTICKMEQRVLEVTLISAQGLKNVRLFGQMTLYAVVWVYCNMIVSTPIDAHGSVNPTWNALLKLIVEQWILEQPYATLNIDIYDYGSISNEHVGSCKVPLSHFQEMDSKGADRKKVISLLVYRPSGRPQGMLHLSLKLGDLNQPPAMPGGFAPVAQTVEPNNIIPYPAGYPIGYNQAGGNQYPQHQQSYPLVMGLQHPPPLVQCPFPPPSQHPQSYPGIMGPPVPYSLLPVQYAVPPPPRRTGLFGGDFAKTLLRAARRGLFYAQLAGAIGGGGYGGGVWGAL